MILKLGRHLGSRRLMKKRTTRIMRITTIKMKMILFNSWKMKMTMRMRKYEKHLNDVTEFRFFYFNNMLLCVK